jgi:riboflavin biosynthesis pyrimidine reductase
MQLRRLLPDCETVALADALGDLRLADLAPPDRPYVICNMVASGDGRTSLEGRSAPLSDPADRELFHMLREQVDAVLAGTGTLRAERYRRLVRDPERRARRAARGLAEDPLAVVLTRSGNLPDIEMLTDPAQPRAVFKGVAAEPRSAFESLRAEHGVRSVLVEGGATLNGSLLHDGLLDELFLSLAPVLVGGEGRPIVDGPALDPPASLELAGLLQHEHALYLRYRVGLRSG